jgi:hypothetical protein
MARKLPEGHRITTVELSTKERSALKALRRIRGKSQSEAIREAIRCWYSLVARVEEGQQLCIRGKEGDQPVVLEFL